MLSCANGTIHNTQVVVDTSGLRNGDLLFRNGNGMESRLVTGMSGGEYSHIAFAHKSDAGWMAVHAVPGETENIKDIDTLKSEPIELFFHNERARSGAIARVNCTDETAMQAVEYAIDKVKRKFAFDHGYSLEDTTEYYCTELIYRAYLTQGIDLAEERRHELPMPGTEGYFIFPSDILNSKHMLFTKQLETIPF
jgi:uncharacterized protein YycO